MVAQTPQKGEARSRALPPMKKNSETKVPTSLTFSKNNVC
jgi:hypothetical protein